MHGITSEFLADKPLFADIVDDLLEFIGDGELVIHNAPFDLAFLDYEFSLLGNETGPLSASVKVLDTLEIARDLHPGQRNNLDALCKRYDVDNSSRTLHGALLDAEILAEVYLAMTGGQTDLGLSLERDTRYDHEHQAFSEGERLHLRVLRASEKELASHRERLEAIKKQSGKCLWLEEEGA